MKKHVLVVVLAVIMTMGLMAPVAADTDECTTTERQWLVWTGGPTEEAPPADSESWNTPSGDPQGQPHQGHEDDTPYQVGQGNADWFMWRTTEVVDPDCEPDDGDDNDNGNDEDEGNTLEASVEYWCVTEDTWGFEATIEHVGDSNVKRAELQIHQTNEVDDYVEVAPGETGTITRDNLPASGPHWELFLEQTVGEELEWHSSIASGYGVDFDECTEETETCPEEERSARGYCPDDAHHHEDERRSLVDEEEPVEEEPVKEEPVETEKVTTSTVTTTTTAAAETLPETGIGILLMALLGLTSLSSGVFLLRRK